MCKNYIAKYDADEAIVAVQNQTNKMEFLFSHVFRPLTPTPNLSKEGNFIAPKSYKC
jgi:hypothetical protein